MPQVVGLDIGTRSVKAALFERGFRGLELSSFHRVGYDPADPEALGRALAEVSSRLGGGAPTVVARIPGDRVLLRFLDLPMSDARKLEQVIPFEVESQVPYELDELVLDHAVVARNAAGGSRVLVAAARRDDVRGEIDTLAARGLEPRVITAGPAALAALASAVPALAHGVIALVDAGISRTDVCVLREGKPAFVRTISGGLAEVSQAHASAGGHPEDLENVDLSAGSVENEALRAAGEFVAREIRRTLLSAEMDAGLVPERVVLFGGLAKLRGFAALVERTAQTPVEPLPIASTEWAKSAIPAGDENEAGAAVALAFRAVADGAIPNFRKNEFAFKRDAKELSGVLTRVAALGGILLVLAGVHYVVQERLLASEKKNLDKQIAAEVLSAFPDAPKDRLKDGDTAVSIMRGNVDDAMQRLSQLGGGGASVLDVLRAVSDVTPAGMYIDVKEFELTDDGKVRMKILVDSYEDSDKLQTALKNVKMFANVDSSDATNDPSGKRRVTIKFDLVPGASVEES